MKNILTPIEDRFWAKVDKNGPGGCWLWTGSVSGKYPHGEIGKGRRGEGKVKTHRLSWELRYGPIQDNLQVLHKCDVGRCVNPDHLFLGTQKDNMIDCATKGRVVNQNTQKTECKYGHPLSGDNLVIKSTGTRQCRVCMRRRDRERRARNR